MPVEAFLKNDTLLLASEMYIFYYIGCSSLEMKCAKMLITFDK